MKAHLCSGLRDVCTQVSDLTGAIDAYEAFDERREGWHKVGLDPASI